MLTIAKSREFPSREVTQEGKEVVRTNEVDTDSKGEPRNSLQPRRKRPRVRQESMPRKTRRIDKAAVEEERLRRASPVKLRAPNFWARSKMKARRLILEADNSIESMAAVARGQTTLGVRAKVNMARERSDGGEEASDFGGKVDARKVKQGYKERQGKS